MCSLAVGLGDREMPGLADVVLAGRGPRVGERISSDNRIARDEPDLDVLTPHAREQHGLDVHALGRKLPSGLRERAGLVGKERGRDLLLLEGALDVGKGRAGVGGVIGRDRDSTLIATGRAAHRDDVHALGRDRLGHVGQGPRLVG
jgi:hypothetical protein